jgi:hypothetical protein
VFRLCDYYNEEKEEYKLNSNDQEENYNDECVLVSRGFAFVCNGCGRCSSIDDVEIELCSACSRWVCRNMGRYITYKSNIPSCLNGFFDDDDAEWVEEDIGLMVDESTPYFAEFYCNSCIKNMEPDDDFVCE